MDAERIPMPEPDPTTLPFWEAARAHELRIQHCPACGAYQHFPGILCSTCGEQRLEWARVGGRGTVYTYVVVHHAITPGFGSRGPYVVAWIELPDAPGARVLSDLVECAPEEVSIGTPVEVVFDDSSPEFTIPRFRPVRR